MGVAPTRKPVFKSCDVVPPLEAAMQTTAPTDRATTLSMGLVMCRVRKIKHVSASVATVIPEMGFDDEPISPVSREETVTNKNPKINTRPAPSTPLITAPETPAALSSCTKNTAKSANKPAEPSKTTRGDRSRSVREIRLTAEPPRRLLKLER